MDKPLDQYTVSFIREQISHFDSAIICKGSDDTHEEQLINMYADGQVQGYKDAVKQILEMLDDLGIP